MARTFYAFEHEYGGEMADRRGRSIGQVYQFRTKAARDLFVSLGPDYINQKGWREPISATAPEVRSAVRADYWTVEDGDVLLAAREELEAERDWWASQSLYR
jgi:hypothetical protein